MISSVDARYISPLVLSRVHAPEEGKNKYNYGHGEIQPIGITYNLLYRKLRANIYPFSFIQKQHEILMKRYPDMGGESTPKWVSVICDIGVQKPFRSSNHDDLCLHMLLKDSGIGVPLKQKRQTPRRVCLMISEIQRFKFSDRIPESLYKILFQ